MIFCCNTSVFLDKRWKNMKFFIFSMDFLPIKEQVSLSWDSQWTFWAFQYPKGEDRWRRSVFGRGALQVDKSERPLLYRQRLHAEERSSSEKRVCSGNFWQFRLEWNQVGRIFYSYEGQADLKYFFFLIFWNAFGFFQDVLNFKYYPNKKAEEV